LTPFLSIIIPAHNEEKRLPNSLGQIYRFMEKQDIPYEVIVVENGSTDRTYQIAKEYVDRQENFHVIRNEQRGKGLAVQRGMKEARGEYLFLCDADLSMPV
jgi:glycosyltransferase involved in cell wall biosynthesis